MGYSVAAVAHSEETLSVLEEKVDKILWIQVGQLNRLISFLKKEGVTRAVMAGAINKARFFSNFRPDLRLIKILVSVTARKDDIVLRAVADELEREGITIEGATRYVPSLVAVPGSFGSTIPTRQQSEDLRFGFQVAREIARAGVGHCVVVKRKTVLAVESIEGTDETIRRSARFATGVVVVKVSNPHQDFRFDLPTVGLDTIRVMKEAGASCLGVEAGKTLILERARMVEEANAARIVLVGLEGD